MAFTMQIVGATVAAASTATGPAAGAAIATIPAASLPSGTWVVFVVAGYGAGTAPAAAENANMRLLKGSTPVGTLAVPGGITVVPFTFIVELDGASALSVAAVGAGTAGVVYVAGLYAYRAG